MVGLISSAVPLLEVIWLVPFGSGMLTVPELWARKPNAPAPLTVMLTAAVEAVGAGVGRQVDAVAVGAAGVVEDGDEAGEGGVGRRVGDGDPVGGGVVDGGGAGDGEAAGGAAGDHDPRAPAALVVALSNVTVSAPPESARNRPPVPLSTTLEIVRVPTVAVFVLAMSKPVVSATVKPVRVLPLARVTPLPAALAMVGSVPAAASVVPDDDEGGACSVQRLGVRGG